MLISRFSGKDLTESINRFEHENQVVLPEVYKRFITKYNGGVTVKTRWTGKKKCELRGFYGINLWNVNWDLNTRLRSDVCHRLLKKNLLAIAGNYEDDYFCINCEDESIWFVYHDSLDGIQVAKDFNEFIENCESEKIGHIPTIEERKNALIESGFGNWITKEKVIGWKAEIEYFSNIRQEELVI